MSTDSESQAFFRLEQSDGLQWPPVFAQLKDSTLIEHVWAQAFEVVADDDQTLIQTRILFDQEIVLSLPGVDAVSIAIAAGSGGTVIPLELEVFPSFRLE